MIASLLVEVVHASSGCYEIFFIQILISANHALEDFDDLAEMSLQLRDCAIPVTKFIVAICLSVDSIDKSLLLLFFL